MYVVYMHRMYGMGEVGFITCHHDGDCQINIGLTRSLKSSVLILENGEKEGLYDGERYESMERKKRKKMYGISMGTTAKRIESFLFVIVLCRKREHIQVECSQQKKSQPIIL